MRSNGRVPWRGRWCGQQVDGRSWHHGFLHRHRHHQHHDDVDADGNNPDHTQLSRRVVNK